MLVPSVRRGFKSGSAVGISLGIVATETNRGPFYGVSVNMHATDTCERPGLGVGELQQWLTFAWDSRWHQ